jgi:hypothetical protein
METGKLYFVDSQQNTHQMFATGSGSYYRNQFGQNTQVTQRAGSAYYVDFRGQKKTLEITSSGSVVVVMAGREYQVSENQQGLGFIRPYEGRFTSSHTRQYPSTLLGSEQMTQFKVDNYTDIGLSGGGFQRPGDMGSNTHQ